MGYEDIHCPHGHTIASVLNGQKVIVGKKCELCERDAKVTVLKAEIERLEAENKSLKGSVLEAWEPAAAKAIIRDAGKQDAQEIPTFACIAFEFFSEYVRLHPELGKFKGLEMKASHLNDQLFSFYQEAAALIAFKPHTTYVKKEE
jgi:uncharacterized small protein (DUF1192 family)